MTMRTRACAALRGVVVTTVLIAGGAACSRPSTGAPRYGPSELQRDLDAIEAVGAAGVLAEVRVGGHRLSGTSGVADLASGRPVDPAGHFRMGSNTKTFVAVIVLQLVGEGRVSLEDTVERWLPGVVAGNGNDGRAITVRQLLQHTSGLHNYTDDLLARTGGTEAGYRALQFATFEPSELVGMAMAHPPGFAPGQGWRYSNTNYVLAGMVIERVTGRAWAREVHDRILAPLGLRDTAAPGDATTLADPHATGYLYLEPGRPLDVTGQNMTWAGAAGSLTTTAADLGRFWRALARGQLLAPAQQADMRRTVLATDWQEDSPGTRYGLGVEWRPLSCGGGFWAHGGDVPGFTTVNGVTDDAHTTVVVSLSTTAVDEMHPTAWALVDHALCDRA